MLVKHEKASGKAKTIKVRPNLALTERMHNRLSSRNCRRYNRHNLPTRFANIYYRQLLTGLYWLEARRQVPFACAPTRALRYKLTCFTKRYPSPNPGVRWTRAGGASAGVVPGVHTFAEPTVQYPYYGCDIVCGPRSAFKLYADPNSVQ